MAGPGAGRSPEGVEQKGVREDHLERRVEIWITLHELRSVGRNRLAVKGERRRVVACLQVEVAQVDKVFGHVGVTLTTKRNVDDQRLAQAAVRLGELSLRAVR